MVVNEKDISFHKKPEVLLPGVFESLQKKLDMDVDVM